jgi:hypothetical protein
MSVDPTRIRRPSRGFGWIDHRVLSGGYLAMLDCTQVATYCTLCLVADRHGISFYRPESLARIVKRPTIAVVGALAELARHQLIACEGRYVQVRDLDEISKSAAPADASTTTPPCARIPPAASAEPAEAADVTLARLSLSERERLFKRARERFERFMGKREPSTGALAAVAVGILREEEVSCRTRS